jgi:spoIIIJ-associated protein
MITEEQKNVLKEVTTEILEKLNIKGTVYIVTDAMPGNDESVCVQIQSQDSGYLIGKSGNNLFALQHLIRILVSKRTEEKINFIVDVNSYVENQREEIIEKANNAISEVEETGKEIELSPMNSYERRLVHVRVSQKNKVESESIGEGLSRRVLIKPIS